MDINFDQLRQSTFLYLLIFTFIHFILIKAIHREQDPDEPPDDRQQQQAEPGQRREHQKVFPPLQSKGKKHQKVFLFRFSSN